MANRNKQGATPRAPQNQPEISMEQREMIERVKQATEGCIDCMVGLSLNESATVLKTVEGVIQGQVGAMLNTTKLERPDNA